MDGVKAGAKKSTWQLQEAKNAFSEVVQEAVIHGPQTVTKHGKPVVKIIPIEAETAAWEAKRPSILDILLSCPEPLMVDRMNDPVRDIKL